MEIPSVVMAEAEANYATYNELLQRRRDVLVTTPLRSFLANIIELPHLPSSSRNAFRMRYGLSNVVEYVNLMAQASDTAKLAAAHAEEHLDVYIEAAREEMNEHFEAQAFANLPDQGQLELPF